MAEKSRIVQYLVTLCVSFAFVVFGVISAWASPVIPKFKRGDTDVHITDAGISWMVSVKPIGFIVGSFVSRYTMDKLGRRATIIYSAIPVATATVLVQFSSVGWMLCVSMFLWSCGTGMISTAIGVYLAEISDKDIRATLMICTRFSFNLGTLLVISIGPFLSYNTLNYSLLPMSFIYFGACLWIPETPYFLIKIGREYQAKEELRKLRGYGDEQTLAEEFDAIKSSVNQDMAKSSSAKELFTGTQYRRAIIVSAAIKFTQIMTGGGTIRDYLGVIMQEGNVGKHYEGTVFIIFGVVTFVTTIISSIFVDRVGRRPLLMLSYIGTAVSLIVIGVYFFLLNVAEVDHSTLSIFGFVPLLGIIMSNIISSFGFIALTAVIPAELFPLNVKAVAMTFLSIFGGVLGFMVGKGYQNVKDSLGIHTVFWIFASVAVFGAVFTYFVVPETRGKSLNEIQEILRGESQGEKNRGSNLDLRVEEAELEVLQSNKSRV